MGNKVSDSGVSRRTVTKGAVWSVPVLTGLVAVPAMAASPMSAANIVFLTPLPDAPDVGSVFASDISVQVTDANAEAVTDGTVTLTITGDAYFLVDGVQLQSVDVPLNAAGIAMFGTTDSGFPLYVSGTLTTGDISINAKVTQNPTVTTGATSNPDAKFKVNNLYTWGINNNGQLGITTNSGTSTANPTPTSIGGGQWSTTASGLYHSFGIKNGQLYAWGLNRYGQLGTTTNSGTTTANPTPILIDSGSTSWTAIAAGYYHSLGIKNGQLYAWGINNNGQLGTTTNSGTSTANPTPILIDSGSTGWTAIAAGYYHSLGIKNGQLYTWGYNNYGQLGTTTNSGTSTANPTPILIDSGSTTWTAVTAGSSHSLGIKNGQLYTWGYNNYGQLGNGTSNTTANSTPILINSGSTGWTAIAAGYYHSLGIKNSQFYAWGNNSFGQLGTTTNSGTSTANSTPILINSGSTSWTAVAAGSYHSLGIKNSNLYTWGHNRYGQLGTTTNSGTTTANPTPIQIGSYTWSTVAAGYYHSLGIRI
ncbi:MAG: hypothetical protein QM613_06730 [Micrococcaceae bacterium]